MTYKQKTVKFFREFKLCGYSLQKNRVYLHFCRREKWIILAFTVHHTGSTKNIQDLRNLAHFAQKTLSRKYKKKPAIDGERVSFEKCAQQASNSRRRGVQNTVHNFYTKSTENLSIFYIAKDVIRLSPTEKIVRSLSIELYEIWTRKNPAFSGAFFFTRILRKNLRPTL